MYKFLILLALFSGTAMAEKLSFQENLNLSTDRISALDVINGAGEIDISSYDGQDIQVNATIESKKYRSMKRFKEVFERDMVFALDRESEYAVLRGHSKPDLRKSPEIQIHLDIQIPADLDVDIDEIDLSDVTPLEMNLSNLQLNGQDFVPNCWGNLKFC